MDNTLGTQPAGSQTPPLKGQFGAGFARLPEHSTVNEIKAQKAIDELKRAENETTGPGSGISASRPGIPPKYVPNRFSEAKSSSVAPVAHPRTNSSSPGVAPYLSANAVSYDHSSFGNFAVGDPIVLSVEFHTNGWTICTFPAASIHVLYAKRDGVRIIPVPVVVNWPNGPACPQEFWISGIGQWLWRDVPFGFSGDGFAAIYDFSTRGAMSVIRHNPLSGPESEDTLLTFESQMYKLDKPGVYTLKVIYKLADTEPLTNASADPLVYTGRLESNEVQFTIH